MTSIWMLEYIVKLIFSMDSSLFCMIFSMKSFPLSERNVVQNATMMDKELISEFVDSYAGRRITVMASNFICRVCVPSGQDGFLPLLWWIRFNVINLSPGGWLMPWGMVKYQEFRVGLWTWEGRHSERVPGQSWLECIRPWHWAHPPPPSMPSWSFCFRTHLQSIGFCGGKKGPISTEYIIWLPDCYEPLQQWLLFGWCAHGTWLSSHDYLHDDRCIYILLSQTFVSIVFCSCSFQFHMHPAKLLTVATELLCIYISGHLSQDNQIHCPKFSPPGVISFTTLFQGYPWVE